MQQLEGYFFETLMNSNDRLQAWRKKGWERLLELGWPPQKKEAFQYVSLKDLSIPKPAALPADTIEPAPHSILFVDGFFQGARLPQPLICMKLDAAMLVYGVFLQSRMQRMLKEENCLFAAMNGVFQGKGVFLYVPPHTHIEKPIEIHHRFTGSEMASPRIQISLGQGASVRIINHTSNSAFQNGYIDINLDVGANLFFGEGQKRGRISFQAIRGTLKQGSRLHYFSLSEEMQLLRTSIKVQLLEQNSEVLLQGLSKLGGEMGSHIHAFVEHVAPQTRSRQHFKTILRDKSRSSFEGKIWVHSEAQKTEAYQLNNNLLLSDAAFSYSKPNLEIFADDVKASHGATVSQLNEEDLFYFRSRGISVAVAQEMLAEGFCNEMIDAIPRGIQL